MRLQLQVHRAFNQPTGQVKCEFKKNLFFKFNFDFLKKPPQVAHEVLALEILTLLLESPTDDSVEVAITFLKECGQKLAEVSPRGIHAIFESLRHVLHESKLDKRTQYMIEVMFQVRRSSILSTTKGIS